MLNLLLMYRLSPLSVCAETYSRKERGARRCAKPLARGLRRDGPRHPRRCLGI
jgi:hypothetical protein